MRSSTGALHPKQAPVCVANVLCVYGNGQKQAGTFFTCRTADGSERSLASKESQLAQAQHALAALQDGAAAQSRSVPMDTIPYVLRHRNLLPTHFAHPPTHRCLSSAASGSTSDEHKHLMGQLVDCLIPELEGICVSSGNCPGCSASCMFMQGVRATEKHSHKIAK